MITPIRLFLLIGMLIFSCLFMSAFFWSIYTGWGLWHGTVENFDGRVFGWIMAVLSTGMLICMFLAGSKAGDIIAGLFFPTRPMSLREEQKIKPALEHLQKEYQERYGRAISFSPQVLDMPYINGMAYGQRSIAISTGLLKVGSDEEIEAVIAHEAGHLHEKDGIFNLALFCASFPTYFFHFLFKQIFFLLPKPTILPSSGQDIVWLLKCFILIISLTILSPFIVLWLISFPVIWIFNVLEQAVQWPVEYKADQFAADMGHAEGLISLFERLEDEDIRAQEGFMVKYFHSHPPTALRIDKLERKSLQPAFDDEGQLSST